MSGPVIAQEAPYPVEVVEDKKYFWCSRGLSGRQLFCDGSHVHSDFLPQTYTAAKSRTLYFCGCKHTASAPLCDGSHNAL